MYKVSTENMTNIELVFNDEKIIKIPAGLIQEFRLIGLGHCLNDPESSPNIEQYDVVYLVFHRELSGVDKASLVDGEHFDKETTREERLSSSGLVTKIKVNYDRADLDFSFTPKYNEAGNDGIQEVRADDSGHIELLIKSNDVKREHEDLILHFRNKFIRNVSLK